ncbi:MAG: pyrimidine/purine nucleotide monophosphate nucleosidase domain-containing protein, partial [Rhodanobacteraceae bacterium]
LYLLGILLHPANAALPFPLIFTGPAESRAYFEQIDRFLRLALGDSVAARYRIVVGDCVEVARQVRKGIERVRTHRLDSKDAFFFNWALHIEPEFQVPFFPTHSAMAALNLHRGQEPHRLAANLRRAFSGIVAGNVKEDGMRMIERHGPFEIDGDADVMRALDELLASFVVQQRMKLPGSRYVPCYRVRVG